jgi:large subunit ribosomal protein L21
MRQLSTQTSVVKNEPKQVDKNEKQVIKSVTEHCNKIVQDPRLSRLFAVVMIGGSQFKVTTEDVIMVRNQFYPTIGDKIRLEKVIHESLPHFEFLVKILY